MCMPVVPSVGTLFRRSMYGASAITELAALGAAVGESLVAADLAALVSQKRVARLRNVGSGGSLSSLTGAVLLDRQCWSAGVIRGAIGSTRRHGRD